MLFFGYWGLWFLIGLALAMSDHLKVTGGDGKFSLLALTVWSAILALPSSLVHCTFIR